MNGIKLALEDVLTRFSHVVSALEPGLNKPLGYQPL